jgi:hypothetical protein
VSITHTVGEPVTELARNTFEGTPEPVLKELIAKQPFRARLVDNRMLPSRR